ncbi:hypothetical protein DPMN_113981 [Dreissena polymorpha]|uniref:Sushi domain-containing protein n=1 Tax=Dreissena polymorpha TaxID=45954 RepID=A0A9D4KJ21_DREPO|nr:hypothetical protein DPMN_113981 [Dreissena polymorpha]
MPSFLRTKHIFSSVECNTLDSVSGGQAQQWTDGTSTFANFTCDPGFSLTGEASIKCRSSGTWNFANPKCGECTINLTPSGIFSIFVELPLFIAPYPRKQQKPNHWLLSAFGKHMWPPSG